MTHTLIRTAALGLLMLAFQSPSAWAFDPRFGIDPVVKDSLPELASRRVTHVRSGRDGDLFWADASAVIRVNPDKLFAAAQDYEEYVRFGMPYLNGSRMVERESPERFFIWASMSIATLRSKHYMEVRIHPEINGTGARGMEWQLAPKRQSWPYPQASSFKHSDGSFYIEPLEDGTIYVRYYLSNDVDIPLSGLLGGLIQAQLRKGAAEVIMVLARQAN